MSSPARCFQARITRLTFCNALRPRAITRPDCFALIYHASTLRNR